VQVSDHLQAAHGRPGTDWIDLCQTRRWDPGTDLDKTLGALSDLAYQGKIRHFGHSTFPASAIVKAQRTAQRRNREHWLWAGWIQTCPLATATFLAGAQAQLGYCVADDFLQVQRHLDARCAVVGLRLREARACTEA
jgi:predicted oxidoreductase